MFHYRRVCKAFDPSPCPKSENRTIFISLPWRSCRLSLPCGKGCKAHVTEASFSPATSDFCQLYFIMYIDNMIILTIIIDNYIQIYRERGRERDLKQVKCQSSSITIVFRVHPPMFREKTRHTMPLPV